MCVLLLTGIGFGFGNNAAYANNVIPSDLKQWAAWVLKDDLNHNCPRDANNVRQCIWSGELDLSLDDRRLHFHQKWTAFGPGQLSLPYENGAYLESVSLNEASAILSSDDLDRPSIAVNVGDYEVEGVLVLPAQMQSVALGEKTGIVRLEINGQQVIQPAVFHGELSLQTIEHTNNETKIPQEKESVDVQVWRQISQAIPIQMTTVIDLTVTGKARNLDLGKVLPTEMQILGINNSSGLPVSLSSSGELLVQVDPGHSQISINTQRKGESNQYALPENALLPGNEIWSFERDVNLTPLKVDGPEIYDASRLNNYPNPWLSAPTFLMARSQPLRLEAVAEIENQKEQSALSSRRAYWMDFKGSGYFYRDTVTGRRGELKRINSVNNHNLLHATFNYSEDQVITLDPDTKMKGVELRGTDVSLVAQGRIENGALSKQAWDAPMDSVAIDINVPPGTRIFHVTGATSSSGSWIEQWQLLDFFLVIIVSIAFFKLFGLYGGLTALAGMILTVHEPGAPQLIWLAIILLAGLSKAAPSGSLVKNINKMRLGVLMVALLLIVPFAINQVRTGLHPQLLHGDLSQHGQVTETSSSELAKDQSHLLKEEILDSYRDFALESDEDMEEAMARGLFTETDNAPRLNKATQAWGDEDIFNPNFKAQSGIGIPSWSWKTVSLKFDTQHDEAIMLVALHKTGNMLFQFAQAALLLIMLVIAFFNKPLHLLIAPLQNKKSTGGLSTFNTVSGLLFISLTAGTVMLGAYPQSALADNYPSAELLDELRVQLLKPNECHPSCDFFNALSVKMDDAALHLIADYHMEAAGLVILPGGGDWRPESVTLEEGTPLVVNSQGQFMGGGQLARVSQGVLTSYLPKGRHRVLLTGSLPVAASFDLLLPDKPNKIVVQPHPSWDMAGVYNHKVTRHGVSFINKRHDTDTQAPQGGLAPLPRTHIDSFFEVKRTLTLGEEWRVNTQIRRTSSDRSAISIEIPLIEAERLIESDPRQILNMGNEVRLNFNQDQRYLQFSSRLDPISKLTLHSGSFDAPYIEKWALNTSPLWHIDTLGIQNLGSFNRQGMQSLSWSPKPMSKLQIHAYALEGARDVGLVASRVERAVWTVALADEKVNFSLSMTTNAAFNNPVTLTLPQGANLKSVQRDGLQLPPITSKGRLVNLDLPAGQHHFELKGIIDEGISSAYTLPNVDFGMPVTNYSTRLKTRNQSDKRWFLALSSDAVGPAVLFWGELVVLLLISFALGRKRYAHLATWQWALLSIGFLQLHFVSLFVLAGTFIAFRYRQHHAAELMTHRWRHNVLQVALAVLFVVALGTITAVIAGALMSQPEMQIKGNGSSALTMNWYQDGIFKGHPVMPITIYSVPLWLHKLGMLLWSLWLSYSLIIWAKVLWGNWTYKWHWVSKVHKQVQQTSVKR